MRVLEWGVGLATFKVHSKGISATFDWVCWGLEVANQVEGGLTHLAWGTRGGPKARLQETLARKLGSEVGACESGWCSITTDPRVSRLSGTIHSPGK